MSLAPGGLGTTAAEQVDALFGLNKLIIGRGWTGLAGMPINVAFLVFGAFGTVANIVNRYADWRLMIRRSEG